MHIPLAIMGYAFLTHAVYSHTTLNAIQYYINNYYGTAFLWKEVYSVSMYPEN